MSETQNDSENSKELRPDQGEMESNADMSAMDTKEMPVIDRAQKVPTSELEAVFATEAIDEILYPLNLHQLADNRSWFQRLYEKVMKPKPKPRNGARTEQYYHGKNI